MSKKTFNIEVTMEERWVDYFCSMLKCMQSCGNLGCSRTVGFYADGDGDFRPQFKIDTEFTRVKGRFAEDVVDGLPALDVLFDAG